MCADMKIGKGIFVTGTDTGVGKTMVTAALALLLRRKGIDVGVMKPVETGVEDLSELGQDGKLLTWAAGTTDEPELVTPYRFKAPLAPAQAAKDSDFKVDNSRLVEAAATLSKRHEFLLVEGAGGLMVPLAGGILIADLVKQMELPLMIVSRPNLGTINHTLLTTYAASTMGIPMAGFIINNMPAEPVQAEKIAPYALVSLATADLLGVLNSTEGSDQEKVTALADQLEKLETLPWILMNFGLHHLIERKGASNCPSSSQAH